MARGRMLNKSVSLSMKYHELPDDTCRLLATWTISHLDCNGVFYADPAIVKSLVFPMRVDLSIQKIGEYIDAMVGVKLITLFQFDGRLWQYWPGFDDNQTNLRKDRERSDYPLPQESADTIRVSPQTSGPTPDNAGSNPDNIRKDSGNIPPQSNISQSNINGASAPTATEETEMNLHDLDTLMLAHADKSPTLKAIGRAKCSDNARALMTAFYEASSLPFTKSWTAAANEMDGLGVRGDDVKAAYKKLQADKMSVVDLHSVKKTAIALHASTNGKQPMPQPEIQVEYVKDAQDRWIPKQVQA
jgi:hypothetical protein